MNKILGWWVAGGIAIASSFGIIYNCTNDAIKEPRAPQFQKHNLDIKEINIQHVEDPIWFVKTKNPTVAIQIIFKNEGDRNFKDQPGLISLVFSLLTRGAGPYNSTELRKISDENSIGYSVRINRDESIASLYVVPEKFQMGMEILQEIMINAHFSEDEIKLSKQNIKVNVQQNKVYPDVIAWEKMMQLEYSPEHPYYETNDDVLKNIDKYTRADLVTAYNKLFMPRNARIMVAGNISEEELRSNFEKFFAALAKHKSNTFKDVEQETSLFKEGTTVHLAHDSPQTLVIFSHPGVKSDTKEYFSLGIANEVLGAGMESRLFTELRKKQGIVYSINSCISCYDMICHINGGGRTDPKNRDVLVTKIKEEFRKFAQSGITQEELDAQKISIAVGEKLSSAVEIVSFLSACRRQNVVLNDVNNYMHNYYDLTLKEVNDVIKKVFDPEKLIFVTIGKEVNHD